MSKRNGNGLRVVVSEAREIGVSCALCGRVFAGEGLGHLGIKDGGQLIGFVCAECRANGKASAQERAREYAAKLRRLADDVEGLAERLPDSAKWQSAEALAAYCAELELERRAGVTVGELDEDVPF